MPTATKPTRVILARTYSVEDDTHKSEDWALPLWEFIEARVPFSIDTSVLRGDELARVMHDRFINYVFARLVVGACHALKPHLKLEIGDEVRVDALTEAVEAVIDVDAGDRDRIAWYLDRIGERILRKQANLSDGQAKAVNRFASTNGHRCYLCGRALHYKNRPFGEDGADRIEETRDARSFEIEHVWSQARGGSRHRSNLAASCKACNRLKKHLLSFADMALEQIITTASSPESVRSSMSSDSKFALLWKQGGCCAVCDDFFYNADKETVFLVKKENNQPYHFFNMMAVCEDCNATHNLDGITIRA